MGVLADRINFKVIILSGFLIFSAVYLLFGFASSTVMIFVAFFLYGLYAAATEGIAKAWITNLAHGHDTATAIGFFTSSQSLCSLIASVTAGFIWYQFNSTAMFAITSGIAVMVFLYLLIFCRADENQ
jgi:sugar phosphate permease